MDNKLIKKLAKASYIDSRVDEKKVERIAPNLNRKQLKEYIKALKNLESKFTVYIDHSSELRGNIKKEIEELFPNKRAIFRKNEDLIMGIKITENDIVGNINLRNSLDQITKYFEKYI